MKTFKEQITKREVNSNKTRLIPFRYKIRGLHQKYNVHNYCKDSIFYIRLHKSLSKII